MSEDTVELASVMSETQSEHFLDILTNTVGPALMEDHDVVLDEIKIARQVLDGLLSRERVARTRLQALATFLEQNAPDAHELGWFYHFGVTEDEPEEEKPKELFDHNKALEQPVLDLLCRELGTDFLAWYTVRRAEHGSKWYLPERWHLSSGMAVRNLLRENSYGEQYFGISNLDNIYIGLVERAMDQLVNQEPSDLWKDDHERQAKEGGYD